MLTWGLAASAVCVLSNGRGRVRALPWLRDSDLSVTFALSRSPAGRETTDSEPTLEVGSRQSCLSCELLMGTGIQGSVHPGVHDRAGQEKGSGVAAA